jgi:hypothetical protein
VKLARGFDRCTDLNLPPSMYFFYWMIFPSTFVEQTNFFVSPHSLSPHKTNLELTN